MRAPDDALAHRYVNDMILSLSPSPQE